MKKYLKLSMLCLLCTCLLSTTVFAEPTSSKTKSEITKLEDEVQSNLKEIDSLEEELISVGEKIIKNKDTLEKAEENYEKQYEDMKSIIQFLYESNTDNLKTEKVVSSTSIGSLNSNIEYINQIESYSNEKLTEFKKNVKKIKTFQTKLEKEENSLKEKEKEFKEKNEELAKEINEKKIDLDKLISEEQLGKLSTVHQISETIKIDKNSSVQEKIIAAAYSQLGTPYVWGGTAPNSGLDCSGLTQYCYSQAGIEIPRTSTEQRMVGTVLTQPEIGCIVWWSGHVAIYIGNNQVLHAPQPGDVVKISKIWGNPTYLRMS